MVDIKDQGIIALYSLEDQRSVLIAALNWGLGHASRCIPLIKEYIDDGWSVSLASDGDALEMLRREFSDLASYELPSYQIRYAKTEKGMLPTLAGQLPRISMRISQEKKWLDDFLIREPQDLIISDNRYGLHSDVVRSVIICHQLSILSPIIPNMLTRLHVRMLNRFDECWVPDDNERTLSGELSKVDLAIPIKFIGALSRFNGSSNTVPVISVLAVLSGPEPLRSVLENELIPILRDIPGARLIRGLLSDAADSQEGCLEIHGHLLGEDMEDLLNKAEIVICRSGYTSIMDMVALDKKAILIPTPGQPEQEYLAHHLRLDPRFSILDQSEIASRLEELISSTLESSSS